MRTLIAVVLVFIVTCAPTLPVIPARSAHAFTIFGDYSPSTTNLSAPRHGSTPPGQAKPAGPIAAFIRMTAPPEFGDTLLGLIGEDEEFSERNLADDTLPAQGAKGGRPD
jgi:hypothetical protein